MKRTMIDRNSTYEIVFEALCARGYSESEAECFMCALLEEQMMYSREADLFQEMVIGRKSDPKTWS